MFVADPVAQHRIQPAAEIVLFSVPRRGRHPADLEIDPPDIVGLAVQQGRGARFEPRFEPEPAFGREIGFHRDIGDQETVLEHLADKAQPQHAAQRAGGAVAADQPVGGDPVGPLGRWVMSSRT